jgi:hypothetical protein
LDLQKKSEETQEILDLSEEALVKPSKTMDQYYDLYAHKTQFFSSYNPDMIEEALLSELRN